MITKSATNVNKCTYPYVFTKNARTAWSKIIQLEVEQRAKNIKLLLPSYIGINDKEGSGVFDAVENNGVEFDFYNVTESLQVDIDDCSRQLQTGEFDLLLIIHYFGFSRIDMGKIKKMCDENNVVLVEDCAHAFYLDESALSIGSYGDYSFYSLHKYLPVNSGGLLRINSLSTLKPHLNAEEKIESSVIEQFSISNFNEIEKIRRRNYRHYINKLAKISEIDIMFECFDSDVPQTFPIRVKKEQREKLYYYLLERDIHTISLYYRLIPQISASKFPLSKQISSEILNLPVHQDTEIHDINVICDAIVDFFGKCDA
ncbi:DegT/DnrJ/EryC1/StrS family aminotransferase [Vibrio vulnificus]|uniref:DegT/DnrJ/EryC1/StrS family aminotransferase n=1 Tax=Vibrio vulnificus TaxID=672 RepID=UPI0024DF7BE6|nr:DegT/DnrJ/EryC1/StrS family aminotransferase [Vibrio vulnificus]MDK2678965.1 DegT/DnrJ/EryC1/StrS family aminotransferase [Vibrio vulnificus]MDK2687739.1 DegT/DnrJ/EryC1/StrS family aminotransferase [Vibrio vulnificus]